MSETCDVNVLVYATDVDSPFHESSRRVVERLATGPTLVTLFWPVLLGYLRLVTHPRILGAPLSPATARANLDRLLDGSHVRAVGEGERFWSIFAAVAAEVEPRGNLVPDAHIVALMREHGVATIWTRDRDFRRFDAISVRDPQTVRVGG